jgi:hypothetical protein
LGAITTQKKRGRELNIVNNPVLLCGFISFNLGISLAFPKYYLIFIWMIWLFFEMDAVACTFVDGLL